MNLLGGAGFPVSLLMSGGGLIITAFLIHLLHKPAKRVRLVDRPGGRKQHEGIIPLTGGLAIYGGFVLTSQLSETPVPPVLLLGMTFVLVVGLIDDIYGLSARIRLGTEVFAALIIMFWGGLMIEDLADLVGLGSMRLGFLAIPFTILCTVGFINAFNMADGVDGLASGLAASALVWLIAASWLAGRPAAITEWLLLSTVIGFMLYNARHPLRKKASAFLGDSGSMLLGFVLAWCAIRNAQGPHRILSPIAVAWVLALPVMDTIRLIVQRGLRGQSPFVADREHVHHILLGMKFTPGQTAWLLIGVSTALGGVGVLGSLRSPGHLAHRRLYRRVLCPLLADPVRRQPGCGARGKYKQDSNSIAADNFRPACRQAGASPRRHDKPARSFTTFVALVLIRLGNNILPKGVPTKIWRDGVSKETSSNLVTGFA